MEGTKTENTMLDTSEEEYDPFTPANLAKQLTLEEFISEAKPNVGLVASFKIEAEDLSLRSQTAWEEAFKKQSSRIYE